MGPSKKETTALHQDLVIMENHHDNKTGVEVHNQETEAAIVTTSQEMIAEGIEETGTVAIRIETDTGTAITETEAERRIDTDGMIMTVGLEDKERGGLRNGIQQCNAHRSATAQRKTFDGKHSDFPRSECAN
jgi:hypothetical protein